MLKQRYVEVENIVTYKNSARLSFDAPITIIRGRNKDRKGKDSANAVGKSLLVSMIPTILYEAPPSAGRKKSAKTAHRKGSRAVWAFNRGKDKYQIVQASHGQSLKLAIYKNKKDMGYRDSKDARALLSKLVPITEEQFYTLYYLDTFRPSLLLKASAAQRFDLFEHIVDTDTYDHVYKVVAKRYNELKLGLQKAETLAEQLEEIKASAPEINLAKAKACRKKLAELNKKYTRISDKAYKELNYLAAFIAVTKNDDDSMSLKDVEAALAEAKTKLKKLNTKQSAATQYHADLKAMKNATEKKAELEAKLQKYKNTDKYDEDAHKQANKTISDARSTYATLKESANKFAEKLKTLEGKANNKVEDKFVTAIIDNPKLIEEGEKRVAVLEERRKQFNRLAEHTDKNHTCPTCTQKVSAKWVKSELEDTLSKLSKAKRTLMRLEAALESLEINSELEAAREGYDKKIKEAVKVKSEIHKLEERITEFERQEKKERILEALNDLPSHDLGEELPHPSTYDSKIEKVQNSIRTLENLKGVKEQAAELEKTYPSIKEAQRLKEEQEAKLARISPKLAANNDELQNLSGNIEKAKLVKSQIANLEGQIEEERKNAKDFDIYEKLREAYGAKGLRMIQIESVAAEYVEAMNAMAHLIFPEPIKFDYMIANQVFDITATRSGLTSDVRFLSGSESRAFMLLSVFALWKFVPKEDRLDTLICDEIESGMDSTTQRLFVSDFLPVLNKLIPKIVIITPKSKREFSIPNAREVVVLKEKGVSRLT